MLRGTLFILLVLATMPTATAGPLDLVDLSVRVDADGVRVGVDPQLVRPRTTDAGTEGAEGTANEPPAQTHRVFEKPTLGSGLVANPWLLVVLALGTMLLVGIVWSGLVENRRATAGAGPR